MNKLPGGLLLSIQEGTRFYTYGWNHLCAFERDEKLLTLGVGDLLLFRGDLIHAGADFDKKNYRVHCFLDIPKVDREPDDTNMIRYIREDGTMISPRGRHVQVFEAQERLTCPKCNDFRPNPQLSYKQNRNSRQKHINRRHPDYKVYKKSKKGDSDGNDDDDADDDSDAPKQKPKTHKKAKPQKTDDGSDAPKPKPRTKASKKAADDDSDAPKPKATSKARKKASDDEDSDAPKQKPKAHKKAKSQKTDDEDSDAPKPKPRTKARKKAADDDSDAPKPKATSKARKKTDDDDSDTSKPKPQKTKSQPTYKGKGKRRLVGADTDSDDVSDEGPHSQPKRRKTKHN